MPRLNDLAQGRGDIVKLDPRVVVIRPDFNYRDTASEVSEAHIRWLMESIREVGVQEPITVQYIDGKVLLVNGECRLKACIRLFEEGLSVPYKDGSSGPPLIPAMTAKGDQAEILATSMVANGSLPPSKLEFGKAAARLEKLGWTVDKIAKYVPPHLGLSVPKAKRFVSESMELHQAPIEVKNAVKNGIDGVKISESKALAVVRENRMLAPMILVEEAAVAKSEGKTELRREKKPGEATHKKLEFQAYTDKLLSMADEIVKMVLDDDVMLNEIEKLARKYRQMRRAA